MKPVFLHSSWHSMTLRNERGQKSKKEKDVLIYLSGETLAIRLSPLSPLFSERERERERERES